MDPAPWPVTRRKPGEIPTRRKKRLHRHEPTPWPRKQNNRQPGYTRPLPVPTPHTTITLHVPTAPPDRSRSSSAAQPDNKEAHPTSDSGRQKAPHPETHSEAGSLRALLAHGTYSLKEYFKIERVPLEKKTLFSRVYQKKNRFVKSKNYTTIKWKFTVDFSF